MQMSSQLEELFEFYGTVEESYIDEEFTSHMASEMRQYGKHSVSQEEINQVYARFPKYFENEGPGRRAPVIMIGSTASDRIIVIPIEPMHIKGGWRPVTAFEANTHDRERYEEQKT